MTNNRKEKFMNIALEEAKKALLNGDVPVGAIIVKDNAVIARAFNERENKQDATCHAEILAIHRACKSLKSFRLMGCSMYVTLQPCLMCTGAILDSKISNIYIGCNISDQSNYKNRCNLDLDDTFKKYIKVKYGICKDECEKLLDEFFKRARYRKKVKSLLGKVIEIKKEEAGYIYEDKVLGKIKVLKVGRKNKGKVTGVLDFLTKVALVVGDKEMSCDEIYSRVFLSSKPRVKILSSLGEIKNFNV